MRTSDPPHVKEAQLRVIRYVVCALIVGSPVSVVAEELPSTLLFRCNVKQELFSGVEKKLYSTKESVMRDIELRDGRLTWAGNPEPIGVGCQPSTSEIACEWSEV